MTIQRTDVQNAAHLARIAIDENDIEGYTQDLANILALVDQMQTINTDEIEPMAHPTDAIQRLRPDQVTEENQRDHFQQIAPATENGLYLVPKVIE
ncbi:MAG: Asp-tRNA(Asn)/Glu-tRNA(Gln) amidotransferase subunit GatC [Pseudomonadales bacterium]|nr:Asp-tRNA(Asn)/Glu-tRNA(Gln) amidotransferase subunit GatC [Pseudomonadales bacterium]